LVGPKKVVLHITTVPMTLLFLRGQTLYIGGLGYIFHVITSPGEELEKFEGELGIITHKIKMHRSITPLRDLLTLIKLVCCIRRICPDIVHAHTPKAGLLGMMAAWIARVPVRIFHMRGLVSITATGITRWLLRLSEKVACRLAHRVIVVSNSIRELAVEEGLCSESKSRVLLKGSGNGVDARCRFDPGQLEPGLRDRVRAEQGISSDALVLGFVGRIVRDKGVVELLAAWESLRDQFPALHLLIVGSFEQRDAVPLGVRQALMGDLRVHMPGRIDASRIPSFYAAMDLLTLPTYREGFGNVLLESAAMQIPVVATSVPGCRDAVVDGVTGTLVAVGDADALAGAIRDYLLDPDLRSCHGLAGRQRVLRDFRPEAIWQALYQEYTQLLAKHTARKNKQKNMGIKHQ
jgi:glycosyltransferase involved in cell wall biosynthesis